MYRELILFIHNKNYLKIKRQIAATFSLLLPPVISQRVRTFIYSKEDAIRESAEFIKKSITGSNYIGNTTDLHSFIFSVHGFYDWRNIAIAKAISSEGGDIIEVGANVGTETICYADIIRKNGIVFAFEPFKNNVEWLRKNVKLAMHSNIKIFPYAISDFTGDVNFNNPPNEHSTGEGFIDKDNKEIANPDTVLCFRLDDFYKSFNNLIGIFIDIEGADLLAIRGAREVISAFRPYIIFEVNTNLMKRYDVKIQNIFDLFKRINYKVFKIGKLGINELETTRTKENGNWIGIPVENISIKRKIDKMIIKTAFNPPIFTKPFWNS